MKPQRSHPLETALQRKASDVEIAAARLGRVLDPKLALPPAYSHTGRVSATVALLAAAMGFEARPVTIDDDLPALEQIDVALHASQVRTRRLALVDTWWKTNVPSMVVMFEERVAVVLPGPLFVPQLHRVGLDPLAVDEAIAARISSDALEVIRPLPERASTLRELMTLGLAGTRRDLWIAIIASLAVGVISLSVPLATSLVFSDIVPTGDTTRLIAVVVCLLALSFAAGALIYTCMYHIIRIGDAVEVSTSGAVLDRVLRLPASALRTWSSAELSARILVASTITQAITDGITVGMMSAVMAVLNGALLVVLIPSLGLVAVIAGLLVIGISLYLLRTENRRRLEELRLLDGVDEVTLDLLRGWTPVRLTDGEVAGFGRWAEAYARFRVAFNKRWGVEITSKVTTSAVLGVAGVLFVVFAYRLPYGTVTSASFLAFTSAFGQFSAGITGIALTIAAFARTRPTVERLAPLLAIEPERQASREDPGELRGDIEVRRLSFRYNEEHPWVLRDVSFQVPAGSFVGIVGTSGSGKSTLLRLLLGFEDPRGGAVLYDDSDLANLDLGAVRRQFGVVLQSSLLLPGTLRENVTVSSGPLADSQIWEVLDRVSVGDAVRAMPLGLDTVVDENSTIISGGQRQRILLARALANSPAVLFLDEATSALDNVTQDAVTRNVSEQGVTRVVIAHRLSTIKLADLIVVLDGGTVAEQGTYEELLAQGGLFTSLVERQEL